MKGQAFSTFQLMIAAVVAIAILGILLAIIGGISPQVSSPKHAIENSLREAYSSPGIIKSSAQKVRFIEGDAYPGSAFSESVAGGTPVQFVCKSGITGCNADDPTKLVVDSTFDAKIYATCGDSLCCVGIGTSDIDASGSDCSHTS